MTLTRDQALDLGWAAFDSGRGSTPMDSNVEATWRLLFTDPLDWNLDWLNGGGQSLVDYLTGLAGWMGQQAAGAISPDGHIHVQQLVKAFTLVRAKARADTNGVGSKLCGT